MISIRVLRNGDEFSGLIALSRDFFAECETHHREFFNIDVLKDTDVIRYFSSFCGQDTRKAYIAVNGEQIVGYITANINDQVDYWQTKKIGEISGLMVHQEYRRQGVAGKLLDEAKAFFTAQGVKYYKPYTAVANQIALNFYQKNGLVPPDTTLVGATLAIPKSNG